MPDWYSWKDLLHRWNKKDFELLEYLKQGLQPYSKYGKFVYCPQFCSSKEILEKLLDKDKDSTTNFGWDSFAMPSSDDEIKKVISLLEPTRFKRDNVLEIEKNTGLCEQTKIPLKWLNGCHLMERWGIDTFDLGKLIFEYDLPAYDSVTLRSVRINLDPSEMKDENHLTRRDFGRATQDPLDKQMEFLARIRFKLHEVEKFEKENEDLFSESELPDYLTTNDVKYENERLTKEIEELKSYIKRISSSSSEEALPLQTSEDQNSKNYFHNKCDYWEVMFDGKKIQLRDLKRLHYVIRLLEDPNSEFKVDELYDRASKPNSKAERDKEEYEVYREMSEEHLEKEGMSIIDINELDISPDELKVLKDGYYLCLDNLKDANRQKNSKKIEITTEEFYKYHKYCYNEYGIKFSLDKNGKLKCEIKKRIKSDKIRTNIKTNIVNAIKDIKDKHESLAEHLDIFIDTGIKCVYRPPDGVHWDIIWKPS